MARILNGRWVGRGKSIREEGVMSVEKAGNELHPETIVMDKAKKRYLSVVKSSFRKLNYCVNNEWKESKTTKYMPVTDSSTLSCSTSTVRAAFSAM